MKTILLATDGSPSAEGATAQAIELAQATGAELHVVTAWAIAASSFGYPPLVLMTPELAEAELGQAEAALGAAVETARAAGLDPKPELRRGEPAEAICAVAKEIGADMIVIGSHGWNVVKRSILGSVSTRVTHHAPCAVLIVRAEPAVEHESAEHEKELAKSPGSGT